MSSPLKSRIPDAIPAFEAQDSMTVPVILLLGTQRLTRAETPPAILRAVCWP